MNTEVASLAQPVVIQHLDMTIGQRAEAVPTCRMDGFCIKSKPKHSRMNGVGTRRALSRHLSETFCSRSGNRGWKKDSLIQ